MVVRRNKLDSMRCNTRWLYSHTQLAGVELALVAVVAVQLPSPC